MIEVASRAINDDMLSEFTARNNAVETLVTEHGVELRPLPSDVLQSSGRWRKKWLRRR